MQTGNKCYQISRDASQSAMSDGMSASNLFCFFFDCALRLDAVMSSRHFVHELNLAYTYNPISGRSVSDRYGGAVIGMAQVMDM